MGKGFPRSMSRGRPQRQEIIKQNFVVRNGAVVVSAAGVGVGFGSVAIGDFPEGNILILGAIAYFAFAGSGADANLIATWEGDFSLGSAPDADGALAGAEVDLTPSVPLGPAVAEVVARTRAANATQLMLDNTDGSLEINLNVLVDAASITDASSVNLTVNGELQIAYIVLGDD